MIAGKNLYPEVSFCAYLLSENSEWNLSQAFLLKELSVSPYATSSEFYGNSNLLATLEFVGSELGPRCI